MYLSTCVCGSVCLRARLRLGVLSALLNVRVTLGLVKNFNASFRDECEREELCLCVSGVVLLCVDCVWVWCVL